MPEIITGVTKYNFGTMSDAIKRMNAWSNDGLASEKDLCDFIIQLFHEIPEQTYNDIITNQMKGE